MTVCSTTAIATAFGLQDQSNPTLTEASTHANVSGTQTSCSSQLHLTVTWWMCMLILGIAESVVGHGDMCVAACRHILTCTMCGCVPLLPDCYSYPPAGLAASGGIMPGTLYNCSFTIKGFGVPSGSTCSGYCDTGFYRVGTLPTATCAFQDTWTVVGNPCVKGEHVPATAFCRESCWKRSTISQFHNLQAIQNGWQQVCAPKANRLKVSL